MHVPRAARMGLDQPERLRRISTGSVRIEILMVGTAMGMVARVVCIGAALSLAAALNPAPSARLEAQITNESPPPGYPPSGCDRDQRGNKYCWGAAAQSTTTTTQAPPPPPVFNGCYHWFNGGQVVLRPDHTVVAGPFTGKWQVVSTAQRTFAITWSQPGVSTVTVSADQKTLAGGNQYGGVDMATRTAGTSGLVGSWKWVDMVTSQVIVKPDGTYSGSYSTDSWHGTWKAVKGSARTYALTASDLPKDSLTLAPDGMTAWGSDQYGLKISGTKTCSAAQ